MGGYRTFCITNCILKVLLMFIMCQCLFRTSLVFGNERLNVTGKGFMPAQIRLEVLLRSGLFLRPSTLLICLWMLASLLPF